MPLIIYILSVIFISAIFAFTLILLLIYLYFKNTKKYKEFVLNNSIKIKKLQEISKKYKFFPHIDFNQSNVYDNEKVYCDINCFDYLIYQLQFISNNVINQIAKENKNKQMYSNYLNEIKNITEEGCFFKETGKLKQKRLIAVEKQLSQRFIYSKPHTEFSIKVTLFCSTINGQIYSRKSETFYANDILTMIKRLNNRTGNFFNDRYIWDSICKIERGKVSNKLRFLIYQRDGYKCRKCGISQEFAKLEIDHIVPISKGGKSDYNNLQTLCHLCNIEKSNLHNR